MPTANNETVPLTFEPSQEETQAKEALIRLSQNHPLLYSALVKFIEDGAKMDAFLSGKIRLHKEAHMSDRQVRLMNHETLNELVQAVDSVIILVQTHHISVEQLTHMPQEQRKTLFSNLNSVESIEIIAELQSTQRSRFCTLL